MSLLKNMVLKSFDSGLSVMQIAWVLKSGRADLVHDILRGAGRIDPVEGQSPALFS